MAAKRNATGLTLASDLQRKTLNDEELVSYVIKYVQRWKLTGCLREEYTSLLQSFIVEMYTLRANTLRSEEVV